MRPHLALALFASGLCLCASATAAGPARPHVDTLDLARRWDHINFEIHDPAQAEREAEALERDAAGLAREAPRDPGPLIWQGMALLAKADARRDFGSLSLADRARKLLERAIDLDAQGEDAAFAEAALGTLYADIPGFPLGFGDRGKARRWFARAIATAPDEIDVEVLYGAFLLHQRDYPAAAAELRRALEARPRPGREIADKYRRQEAATYLNEVQKRAARR